MYIILSYLYSVDNLYQIVPITTLSELHNVYGVTYVQLSIIIIEIKIFDWSVIDIEPQIIYAPKI